MSAYFAVDENGLIKEVYSNEELQDSYQELFPNDPADVDTNSLSPLIISRLKRNVT